MRPYARKFAVRTVGCPACGLAFDRVCTNRNKMPAIGDVAVCGQCQAVLMIEPQGMRIATVTDLDDLERPLAAELHALLTMLIETHSSSVGRA